MRKLRGFESLYPYVADIVRPVWNVVIVRPDGSEQALVENVVDMEMHESGLWVRYRPAAGNTSPLEYVRVPPEAKRVRPVPTGPRQGGA